MARILNLLIVILEVAAFSKVRKSLSLYAALQCHYPDLFVITGNSRAEAFCRGIAFSVYRNAGNDLLCNGMCPGSDDRKFKGAHVFGEWAVPSSDHSGSFPAFFSVCGRQGANCMDMASDCRDFVLWADHAVYECSREDRWALSVFSGEKTWEKAYCFMDGRSFDRYKYIIRSDNIQKTRKDRYEIRFYPWSFRMGKL